MARNGSGVYTPPGADFPAVASTLISSSKFNNTINDIATALTASVAANGETTITAAQPMAGFRHTAVGNAAARNEYAAMGQVQDQTSVWGGTAGGTANALTLTPTPAITAYVAGQIFRFIAGLTSTGAITIAVSGLATKAVQMNAAAMVSGEIVTGLSYEIVYNGTAFQLSKTLLTNGTVNTGFNADTVDGRHASSTGIANSVVASDAAGNVGLGVTPNAWASEYKAIQANSAALMGRSGATPVGAWVSSNCYYDGAAWRAIATGTTSILSMYDNGALEFSNSGSVASGAIASQTIRLALDATGRITAGVVPVARITKNGSGFLETTTRINTVATAVGVTAYTLTLPTVAVGDIIFISCTLSLTKGATAGVSTLRFARDSGTAAISALVSTRLEARPASSGEYLNAAGFATVTTAGTLVIKVIAESGGSDSTINADGVFQAMVYPV